MSAIKFNASLTSFFDRDSILSPAKQAEKKFLGRFGAYCRQTVMNSIRNAAPHEVSPIGHAPFNHPNGPFPGGYKRTIFFCYDAATHAVYIGPIKLNQQTGSMQPNVLEDGGDALVRRGTRRKWRLEMWHFGAHPHMKPGFARAIERPQFRAMLEDCVINESGKTASFRK